MNLHEYLPLALRTFKRKATPLEDSIHMLLGLGSEIGDELDEAYEKGDAANILEEIGDAFWFAVVYSYVWGLNLPEKVTFIPEQYMDVNAMRTIGKMQNLDKGVFVFDKVVNKTIRQALLTQLIINLEGLAFIEGFDSDVVRRVNIDKLKARFADKFTSEEATNRDLTKEREILEAAV